MKISYFKNVEDKSPVEITIDDFMSHVVEGKFKDYIGQLRNAKSEGTEKKLKSRLPCYTISSVCEYGHAMHNVVEHSGLICLDFDRKENSQLTSGMSEVKEMLAEDMHSMIVCESCSGKGLMVIVKMSELDHLNGGFDQLRRYYIENYGLKIDKQCKDITRLRYATHDEDLRYNENSVTFEKQEEVVEEKKEEIHIEESILQSSIPPARQAEIRQALSYISPNDYEDWLSIGFAIHSEDKSMTGYALFKEWSFLNDTENKYSEPNVMGKWSSFGKYSGRKISIDTLFKRARDNDWGGFDPALQGDFVKPPQKIKVTTGDKICRSIIPEPDWLIKGVLQKGRQGALVAPPKHYKSFIVHQMAMCIVSGRPFLDFEVPQRDDRHVFFLNLEVHEEDLGLRHQRMAQTLGVASGDLSNMHIFNARCAKPEENFKINDATELIFEAQQYAADKKVTPCLIVIDCLYKMFNGNENNSEDMGYAIDAINDFCARTGACILVVHHDAKGSSADRDMMDRGSGSNKLTRNVDFMITLTAQLDNKECVIFDAGFRNCRGISEVVAKFNGTCLTSTDMIAEPATIAAKAKKKREDVGKVSMEKTKRDIVAICQNRVFSRKVLIDVIEAKGIKVDSNKTRFYDKYITPLADAGQIHVFDGKDIGTYRGTVITGMVGNLPEIQQRLTELIEDGTHIDTAITKVNQEMRVE